MFYFSRASNGEPSKGIVDKQVGDPFKEWIDGERISENTFDEFHNYLLGTRVFENTDPLIRERGFRALDKMLDTDSGIKSSYWAKIFSILSEKNSINPHKEGCERSEKIADFVKWNINYFLQTPLRVFLRKMLDGMRQGFKIAEIVWKVIDDGPYKGMIGLHDLVVRDSRNYSFLTDAQGRIDPMGIIEGISSTGVWTAQNTPRQLPANKFVIYAYLATDDDAASLYGRSDFRSLWRPFYGDVTAHRLELRSAETFARPPLVGSVEDGTYTKGEQIKVQKDLAGAYNRSYTQIPSGFKIDEIGTQRADTRAFESLNARHTRQVSNGQLMGYDDGGINKESAEFRSYLFRAMLDAISMDLSDIVMERQIIRRLVDYNYRTQKYPMFLMPRMAIDRKDRAEFIAICVKTGIHAPDEPWIRSFLDIPNQDIATRERQMARKPMDQMIIGAGDGGSGATAVVSDENGANKNAEDANAKGGGKNADGKSKVKAKAKDGEVNLSQGVFAVNIDGDSVREVFDEIAVKKIPERIAIIQESDTGICNVKLIKEDVSVVDLEAELEALVNANPYIRFFVCRVFGMTDRVDNPEIVMRALRVIEPNAEDSIVIMQVAS